MVPSESLLESLCLWTWAGPSYRMYPSSDRWFLSALPVLSAIICGGISSVHTWQCPVSSVDPPLEHTAPVLRLLDGCSSGLTVWDGTGWTLGLRPEKNILPLWSDILTICNTKHDKHQLRMEISGVGVIEQSVWMHGTAPTGLQCVKSMSYRLWTQLKISRTGLEFNTNNHWQVQSIQQLETNIEMMCSLLNPDLRVSSLHPGLFSPSDSIFTPESFRSLLLRSRCLRLEDWDLRTEDRSSQLLSDRLQSLSLDKTKGMSIKLLIWLKW